jgi:hypothetical protein
MHPVCIVELHVTVDNITILSVAQKCFYGKFSHVTSNDITYLGLHGKCLIVLSNFNQVWSF